VAKVEKKLEELGITLPPAAAPVANYVPTVRVGNLLFCSGQVSAIANGGEFIKGKLGAEVSIERGQEAARLCAINLLAQAKSALGDLDRIKRCVRLGGFINAIPTFGELPIRIELRDVSCDVTPDSLEQIAVFVGELECGRSIVQDHETEQVIEQEKRRHDA